MSGLTGLSGLTDAMLPTQGLLCHWSARDYATGVTWKDRSGRKNNSTQVTTATQPQLVTNVINGRPVARFDGTRWTRGPDVLPASGAGASWGKVALVKFSAVNQGNNIISGSGNSKQHALWLNGTNAPRVYADGADVVTSSQTVTTGTWYLIVADCTTVTQSQFPQGAFNLSIDGTPVGRGPAAVNGGGGAIANDSTIFLGSFNGLSTAYMDAAELAVYDRPLSAGDRNAIAAVVSRDYGLTIARSTSQVVLLGDSITAGAVTTSSAAWANGIATADTARTVHNLGGPGIYLSQMSAATGVARQLYSRGLKNVAVLFAGTNDMVGGGASAATAYASFQARAAELKSSGYYVIGVTPLSRTDLNDTTRGTFSDSVVAGVGTVIDAAVDVRTDALLGGANACNNATYFDADKVHPNNTGHARLLTLIGAAVTSGIAA